MKGTAEKLQKETNTLVGALKTSYIRGKWGEIGLERLVEFSGMSSYCDFSTQVSVTTYDGRLRPDLIVNLPGEKKIIIDAKVPMASYIQAFETNEDLDKKLFIKKHSVALRDHMSKLGAKNYWDQFQGSVDYVIMYLPIESSFGAALEIDPQLIEDGLKDKVILATPTTLVTMLKTIAFSWQQQKVAENIYQIRDAGIELFDRVSILLNHIGSLGNSLNSASKNYNELVGSFESRFVPQVRKLKEVGGSLMKKEVPEINQIETTVRGIKPGLLGNGVVDEKKDSE
jgi:DNA recombination protein RmuC